MAETANWEPGTLDKTRRNIGDISKSEADVMAKKLGGQVMYEKSTSGSSSSSSGSGSSNKNGRIMRNTGNSGSSGSSKSSSSSGVQTASANHKYKREDLPSIPKKTAASIDKLMMSAEYKIKPNYGFFNFIRKLQKDGTEKIIPEFYTYSLKQHMTHMESFITVIKTLIQIAPATYKTKIASGTETKFKFLRMVAGWSMQSIKVEYINLQSAPNPMLVADLIPITRAIYKPLITLYYYGNNKIPKIIKEIYADESNYPDAPKEKLSGYAKQAITEWLYLDTEIIKKLYPLLLRMCSDSYEPYPTFFNVKVGEILKFVGLHKFDLLLPEKEKEAAPAEKKPKPAAAPQKGVKDSTVLTGLKLLDQLFPQAGFNKLDEHPDMYPYFQPMYKFEDGFNCLSPENPVQVIVVLLRIIEDCFQGCRNIKFVEEDQKKGSESMVSILDEWSAYREDTFSRLYCEPLVELTNNIYSQPEYGNTQIGKKTYTSLLWQVTYHFLPIFKFDQLILEHPADESKYRPLFHRTDYARKFLTLAVNECDAAAKTKAKVKLIENPWDHYKFDITNEVSKRLDVLLGGKNMSANTTATNANLLKYTLCFVAVLDWFINNPDSPAYTTDPMHIFRVSPSDGKPQFSVTERNDQNKLFAEAIKASYAKGAK